jgi:hypothetical protein
VYETSSNEAPIIVTCGSSGGLAAYALNFERDGDTETDISLQLCHRQKQWELSCERLTGLALSGSPDGVKAVTVSEVQINCVTAAVVH